MAKDKIDLHGVRVAEVDDLVDTFLFQLSKSNLKRAKIVTGKGSGKVQAQVVKYLKVAGYPWEYEKLASGKRNEGVIVLFLD